MLPSIPPPAKTRGGSAITSRFFGELSDVPTGTHFDSRAKLADAGVHRPTQAGIAGGENDGAESIVLSGGYADDEDYGDTIVYTGHGGRDENSGKQVADQQLRTGNLALAKSCIEGLPVRVIRGPDPRSPFSPKTGYRYDGLYYVERYWQERGNDGYLIWRYRLVADSPAPAEPPDKESAQAGPAPRRTSTTERIVRNTQAAQRVKALHAHTCQVCGLSLLTTAGPYAEGAHIRPLGRPHDGPDVGENILCLCPNHHVLLDFGAIAIGDDGIVFEPVTGRVIGPLRTVKGHSVNPTAISYHRTMFAT